MRGLVPFKQKGLPPGLAHVSLGSFGEQCAQGIDRCSRVQKKPGSFTHKKAQEYCFDESVIFNPTWDPNELLWTHSVGTG